MDAADSNDDGEINLTDGIFSLEYLFQRGPVPAAPFPERGVDDTADGLSCGTGLANA